MWRLQAKSALENEVGLNRTSQTWTMKTLQLGGLRMTCVRKVIDPTHITHKQWIFQNIAPKLDHLTEAEKRRASQQPIKILKRSRISGRQEVQTIKLCNYKW